MNSKADGDVCASGHEQRTHIVIRGNCAGIILKSEQCANVGGGDYCRLLSP